jgi:hypothetical protein
MGEIATYASDQVTVSFLGIILTNVAEGDFCKISRDEDAFHTIPGVDGIGARTRNNNKQGTITITLQSTSPSNLVLSGIADTDEVYATGIGTISVKDIYGSTKASAAHAWIKKKPEVVFGKEQNTREWIFGCDFLKLDVGGNPD